MKGKLFSLRGNSDITYLNGALYARMRGRMMSAKDKHTVECLDGTPLFNVKKVSCLSPNTGWAPGPERVDLFHLESAFFRCASAALQVTAAVRSLLRPAGLPGLICCFTVSHGSTQVNK